MSKAISAPLLRTARLLDLVPFITTHQGIPLKDLATHFDVTPAQMSADLTTLWMCGLPGYTPLELMDLEFESGYVTISNAPTLAKPRGITFKESVALLLGLDLLSGSLPVQRADLQELVNSLRTRLAQKMGTPAQLSAAPFESPQVLSAVRQAVSSQSGLLINYHSLYTDDVSTRIVSPVDLYEKDGHQYLHAFCFSASDYREFRIDRIIDVQQSSLPDQVGSESRGSEKIQYSITAPHPSREVSERFGVDHPGVDISLSSYSRQWIQRSVMASGTRVILQTPADIRAEIAATAQSLLDRYRQG